jgi:hypothetical protein
VWLDFSKACNYITSELWADLELKAEEVGKLLNHMIENPKKYQRNIKVQKPAKRRGL